MTTVEVLRAARAKIEDPARWIQRVLARDADGSSVVPSDPAAVCWCAAGALYASAARADARSVFDLLDEVAGGEFVSFNEHHSHAEVLAMFDKAIAFAEAEA